MVDFSSENYNCSIELLGTSRENFSEDANGETLIGNHSESSDKLNKLVLLQETSLDCFRQVLILKRNTKEQIIGNRKKIFGKIMQLYLVN